ncbi:hypothetical protein IAT40_002998 [Kwoniella sp. CBS 6097]
MAMAMSVDTEMHISSSPEISPQTPIMSPSPPLREITRSLSLESDEGMIASPHPASQTPGGVFRHPPQQSYTPSTGVSRQASTDGDNGSQLLGESDPRSLSSQPTGSFHRHSGSSHAHSSQRSTLTLPRINTQSPLIRAGPTSTSTTGLSVGFGLEAFKLSSPASVSQTRPHPQPLPLSTGIALPPVHTLQSHSQSPEDAQGLLVGSTVSHNMVHARHSSMTVARPQHQRLASLPSIYTREREGLYPTSTSVAPHARIPASATTTVNARQSEVHPYSLPSHRRHPSADSTRLTEHAQYEYAHPKYQAPPPPPFISSSAPSGRPPASISTGNEMKQFASRPKLQIHPYASPQTDSRYNLMSGIHPTPSQTTSSSSTLPGREGMHQTPLTGFDRDRMFRSPSSGISAGGFKAPRKRADDIQLGILNDVFERTAYPSTEERDVLGKRLGMTSRSVQIWFQNRRRAVKVDAQSAIQRAEAEGQTQIHIRGEHPLKHTRSATTHNIHRVGGHTSMDIKQTLGGAAMSYHPSAANANFSGIGHVRGQSDGSPSTAYMRWQSAQNVLDWRRDMPQPQPQPLAHPPVQLHYHPISQPPAQAHDQQSRPPQLPNHSRVVSLVDGGRLENHSADGRVENERLTTEVDVKREIVSPKQGT